MREKIEESYAAWQTDPSQENMGQILKHMKPMIISQLSQYPGDNKILMGKAKILAADAVRDFDPTMGVRLTTWVTNRLQPLSRYGRQSRQILNIPELAYRQYSEYESKRREFSDVNGKEPSDEEMADAMGISLKRIRDIQAMNPVVASVGATEETDEDSMSAAELPVLDTESDPVLHTAIEAVYDSVDDRDKQIIDLKMGRTGNRVSNQEIAARLGVSPGFVSQRSLELSKQIQDTYGI